MSSSCPVASRPREQLSKSTLAAGTCPASRPHPPTPPRPPTTGRTHLTSGHTRQATPTRPPGHTHPAPWPHPPNTWSHPPRLQSHPPGWALRDQLPRDAVLQALVSCRLQNLGFLLTASFLLFLAVSPSHAISSDDCIWPLWTQSQVQGNCLWDLFPWIPLTFNSAHDESSTLLSRNLALPSVPYTWEPPTRSIPTLSHHSRFVCRALESVHLVPSTLVLRNPERVLSGPHPQSSFLKAAPHPPNPRVPLSLQGRHTGNF